jgi:tRNA nucleotidyltransferase (CCA-adding enzyme)
MDVTNLLTPELVELRKLFVASKKDIRFCGGCVRDTLIGIIPKDIDLHTDATPDEQVAIYQFYGIHYIETGLKHGTVTVVLNGETYEITSLRADVSTDGRHAVVEYHTDWERDLSRRDFTFNAMSVDFDGNLMDPFGGEKDLHAGIVKFVGDTAKRIKEDYLRILRWYRFRGRFEKNGNVDPQAIQMVRKFGYGLVKISRERVWMEISKIVGGENAIDLMCEIHENVAIGCDLPTRITIHFFTEDTQLIFNRTSHPITRLVALYGKKAADYLAKWKASNDEIKMAISLFEMEVDKVNLFSQLAVHNKPREWVVEVGYLRNMDEFDLCVLQSWEIPIFPVTGYDLIKIGLKPGPQYSDIMYYLKNVWVKNSFDMTKEDLLKFVEMP